jgi:hypothetical protein
MPSESNSGLLRASALWRLRRSELQASPPTTQCSPQSPVRLVQALKQPIPSLAEQWLNRSRNIQQCRHTHPQSSGPLSTASVVWELRIGWRAERPASPRRNCKNWHDRLCCSGSLCKSLYISSHGTSFNLPLMSKYEGVCQKVPVEFAVDASVSI